MMSSVRVLRWTIIVGGSRGRALRQLGEVDLVGAAQDRFGVVDDDEAFGPRPAAKR